jgi:hypothetical protein
MPVTIVSAYYGDERSRTNVLSSLKGKLKPDGSLETSVDSSLLPMIQVGGDISLSDDEVTEAKEKATTACGTANDVACIELKSQEFQRQRLQEKENEAQSTANIIKGRRLTATIRDTKTGKESTVEIPDGQKFTVGKSAPAEAPLTIDPSFLSNFSVSTVVGKIMTSLSVIAATFVYAFSVIITYKSFIQAGYTYLGYAATAAAVLIPYSGFVSTLIFFAIREWLRNIPKT